MNMNPRAWAMISCVLAAVCLAGCSEVKGVVTAAGSGAPLENAQVGLIVVRPLIFVPSFPEYARTDFGGNYEFVHREQRPWIYVRSPGFLTQVQRLPASPSVTRNFQLQSIADIIGAWDVEITINGALLGQTHLVFTEDGVHWYSEFGFVGTIDFDFDGTRVYLDGPLVTENGSVPADVRAVLELNEDGELLSGEWALTFDFLDTSACKSILGGTAVALRATELRH